MKLGAMVCALLLAGHSLLGAPSASLQSQLEARYARWDAAYKKGDAVTMAKMLASDFRIMTENGKAVTRKEYVKGLGKGQKPEGYRTRVLKVAKRPGGAYAWTEEVSKMPGQNAQSTATATPGRTKATPGFSKKAARWKKDKLRPKIPKPRTASFPFSTTRP